MSVVAWPPTVLMWRAGTRAERAADATERLDNRSEPGAKAAAAATADAMTVARTMMGVLAG